LDEQLVAIDFLLWDFAPFDEAAWLVHGESLSE
jgi:hypothetical protein